MSGSKVLFAISWVILVIVAFLILLGSFASLANAYSSRSESIGTVTTDQIRSLGGDDAVHQFKARRVTAATWSLAFAILFGWVVVGPYRQGSKWAWWAMLVSLGLSQLLSMARAPLLGTESGVGTSAVALAFLLIGLLAGVPRIFSSQLKL